MCSFEKGKNYFFFMFFNCFFGIHSNNVFFSYFDSLFCDYFSLSIEFLNETTKFQQQKKLINWFVIKMFQILHLVCYNYKNKILLKQEKFAADFWCLLFEFANKLLDKNHICTKFTK